LFQKGILIQNFAASRLRGTVVKKGCLHRTSEVAVLFVSV